MTDLLLYLRREPTVDKQTRVLWPNTKAADVVAYKDEAATEPYARWSWWQKRPTRAYKRVMLNCYRWPVAWLPPLEDRK